MKVKWLTVVFGFVFVFGEEFVYILEGCGLAEIGDETFEVGPGD